MRPAIRYRYVGLKKKVVFGNFNWKAKAVPIGELPVVLAVITHSAVESYVLLPVCPIVGNKF